MKVPTFSTAFACSVLSIGAAFAQGPVPTAILTYDFDGQGTSSSSSVAAFEAAVADAERNAANQGYGGCVLKNYVQWPVNQTYYATATVTCTKDTTPPPPPPPPTRPPEKLPTLFPPQRAADGANHVLMWKTNANCTTFVLERRINNSGWDEVYKGNSTAWQANRIEPATYQYRVRDWCLGSGISEVVSIVISPTPSVPGTPQSSSLVGPTHTIAWAASSGADEYRLERRAGDGWASVYIGPATSWTARDMPGGVYVYRTVACKNGTCSAPSGESAFRVLVDLIGAGKRDANGDGRSDLNWIGPARDNLSTWLMNGGVKAAGLSHPVGPAWAVVASGDFQGDGILDFIWTDGNQMQMWAGTGSSYIGIPIRDYPAGYHVVAVGDVDGDGKSDLVWRDDAGSNISIWLMNGADVAGSAAYPIPQPWRVLASGDLDGNGKLDLIWTNGEVVHAWMGTAQGFAPAAIDDQYPLGWDLLAAYDVDGDGKTDLLWNNATARQIAYWRMNGTNIAARQGFTYGENWTPLQVGDYNGDGKGDIVWTNGQLMQQWSWSGTAFTGVDMPAFPSGWTLLKR